MSITLTPRFVGETRIKRDVQRHAIAVGTSVRLKTECVC